MKGLFPVRDVFTSVIHLDGSGFTATVDGDEVILSRQTNRIRATTPMELDLEWHPAGMPESAITQKWHLQPGASISVSIKDWYNVVKGETSLISADSLYLKWNDEVIHDFGWIRNFYLIKSCEIRYDDDDGHLVTIRLEGEDEFRDPMNDWKKVLRFDNLSPYRLTQDIRDSFPPLCRFQFETPPTKELCIREGESQCGRFWNDVKFLVSYEEMIPSLNYERLSESVANVIRINHNNDTAQLTFENGVREEISIVTTLESPDNLPKVVNELENELKKHVFHEDVEFVEGATTNFTFRKGVHDAHRLVLKKSAERTRNNLRFFDFHPEVEISRLVVSKITGWEVVEAPANSEVTHHLLLKALLVNKFSGETKPAQASIKFLYDLQLHEKQIQHFIPFFGQQSGKLEYYASISTQDSARVEIDLGRPLSILFGLREAKVIFQLCPYTLNLFAHPNNTSLGLIPPELIMTNAPKWTQVARLKKLEEWGRGWGDLLINLGFCENKYLDVYLNEIALMGPLDPESLEKFKEKLEDAITEEKITDSMKNTAYDMAKEKANQGIGG